MSCLEIRQLGLVKYEQALEIMGAVHTEVLADAEKAGVLLLVQHPPVVTMGNRFLASDLILNHEELAAQGVDFVKTDRGGSVTVHEPGQLVVYPIVRLNNQKLSVKKFVWILEQAMVDICQYFGVTAARDTVNPGVWVGNNKIGAIGLRVENHVTRHGLAFNISNSLDTFGFVVPCGLRGKGVTSLWKELALSGIKKELPSFEIVQDLLAQNIQNKLEELLSEEPAKLHS